MIFQKIKNKELGRTLYKIFSIVVMEKIDTPFQKKTFLFGFLIFRTIKFDALERSFLGVSQQLLSLEKQVVRAQRGNAISHLHTKVFEKYKNSFAGRTLVIVGSGPTLSHYEPIDGAIHIGLNRAYKYEKLDLDFLFTQDISGLKDNIKEMNEYRKNECIKFYGYNLLRHLSIPEVDVMEANAYRYYGGGEGAPFFLDIAHTPLADYGSVAFAALSFALYTHPKRICLVGCDVTSHHFFSKEISMKTSSQTMLQGWLAFKSFAENMYPDVEVISINPVGLRGVFQDQFTVEELQSEL